MQIVPKNVQLAFEVTFDRDDLLVGMAVYELNPTLQLLSLEPMSLVHDGTYVGYFTPQAGKSYVIRKSCFLDPSFSVADNSRGIASESLTCYDPGTTTTITPADVAAISEGVWDLQVAGHTSIGSFGRLLQDTFNAAAASGGAGGRDFIGTVVGTVVEPAVYGVVK